MRRAFPVLLAVMSAIVVLLAKGGAAFAQTDLASTQPGESLGAQHETAVRAQAAKTSVWVISKQNDTTFSYNANGFVSKTNGGALGFTNKYQYKGSRIVKFSSRPNSTIALRDTVDGTMAYKSGRLVKMATKSNKNYNRISYTYRYDGKGRISGVSGKYMDEPIKYRFSYDSKGRLTKRVQKLRSSTGAWSTSTWKFAYNSKGNLVKTVYSGSATTYRYAYDKRGLVKKVTPSGGSTTTYSYKKISVPTKYAKQVRKQQTAFQGRNLDFSLPWPLVS